ncbi:MAG: replication-relaxation family protein [Paracoccaceae bacterium]
MYEVLELIYQFKALRSHHIEMHLPHRHNRGLSHSLRRLYDHGLIDKVADLRKFNALYQHDTYTLAEKGRQALAGRDLPPRYLFLEGGLEIKLSREWDHSMMTIDLLSNLVAGASGQGIEVVSAEEIYRQARHDRVFVFLRKTKYTDRKTREVRPYTVVPDGVFGLRYPDGKTAYFAIEAEHNKPNERFDDDDPTSTQSSTKKKFKHYRDINWKAVYSGLDIGNMRVLVVAPTPTQIENKFKVGRKVVKESHLFLGHWLPTVSGKDVPTIPQIIDAPWLRIGLPSEHINAPSVRAG